MPGIVGIIARNGAPNNSNAIQTMVNCMVHESFYTSGVCSNEKLGVWSGWVCHAGSYSDCMPVWNETKDVCLIFSGEHYADPDELQQLRMAGHHIPEENAASLIHLYEQHGPRFFELLNGTFAGLLLDLRENKVILFNDRYGLGRIYCHETPEAFYFSSEAKSLLKVLPHLRQLDIRGYGELLVCGCALQNRTLFEGVSLLPLASAWTFRHGGSVQKETYFNRDSWERQTPLHLGEYYEKLKETFTRILPRYFRGKQRIALSLTGGLDSRMVISAIPCQPGALPCYTFGGMYRECEDVKVGRLIATLCRQPHQVITVDQCFFPDFLTRAMKCVYMTDGAMDVSGAVGVMVNRLARDIAPVRMTGNYGSEILRGNVAFKAGRIREAMFDDSFLPALRAAPVTFAGERQDPRLSFIAFKQVPWHHYARFAEENSQLTIRAPFLDNDLVPLAYHAPPDLLTNKQLSYRFTTESNPALTNAPTDRGMLNRTRMVPKKAFAFYKEFWPRVEYCFDYGMPQWLAKADRVLAPLHLERLFLGQQKYYHFRTWYRHQLANTVKEVLLDPHTLSRSYLNKDCIVKMVTAHTKGTGNYTLEIHKLLTGEFIQRQLLECK